MDYVLGSVAALVSGDVTPNRPRPLKRALTPIKHQASPNVTPKSEFVNDRSIFLSPSTQKKQAVVKKSPKRIFQNQDLETGDKSETSLSSTSPKGDKVKKFLQNELNYDQRPHKSLEKSTAAKTKSSTVALSTDNNLESAQNIGNKVKQHNTKLLDSVAENISSTSGNSVMKNKGKLPKDNDCNKENSSQCQENENSTLDTNNKSLNNVRNVVFTDKNEINSTVSKKKKRSKTKPKQPVENTSESRGNVVESNQGMPKKKNRKRKKSKSEQNSEIVKIEQENELPDTSKIKKIKTVSNVNLETKSESGQFDHKVEPEIEELDQNVESNKMLAGESKDKLSPKKKNKRKKKSKQKIENELKVDTPIETEVSKPVLLEKKSKKYKQSKSQLITDNTSETKIENIKNDLSQSHNLEIEAVNKKAKTVVNPIAITEKESDSEHESDDEIESENEKINNEVFESALAVDESTDEEEELQVKDPKQKQNAEKKKGVETDHTDVNSVDEIKRTLFVGNVPFSTKCKKEIKKIFSKHGKIETIRIRTIPVKDGRYTPKLAVIKNELHPERTTVNVYIKYADEESVKKALSENNTLMNENHLRVSHSSQTGVEHDPKSSIFVGNLPFAIEDEVLRQTFEKCGEIESVRIIRDKKTNAGKGFGYVNFISKDGVELSLALTEEDLTIKNRIIRVKRCTQLSNRQKQKDNLNKAENQYNQGNQKVQGRNPGGQRFNQVQGRNPGGQRFNQVQGRNPGGQRFNQGNQRGHRENQAFQNGQRRDQSFQRGNQNGQRRSQGIQSRVNKVDGKGQYRGGKKLENDGKELQDGAQRRIMNKRKNQDESGDAPPNKMQKNTNPPKEKKGRKEFVGMTAEKKKKRKFDKGQKKKKALSEILTK